MDPRTLPKVMMPMHCTGRNFIARMRTEMPDRLIDGIPAAALPSAYKGVAPTLSSDAFVV